MRTSAKWVVVVRFPSWQGSPVTTKLRGEVEMDFVVGSGNNRRKVTLPAWGAKSHRNERERVVEDVRAITSRPSTFRNHSGGF